MVYEFKIVPSNRLNFECIELKGKKYYISKKELETNAEFLDIDYNEAIQMWLEDEGYLQNEEVEELSKKAKENKTDKIVATDKTKTRAKSTREPKENPVKEMIIEKIAEMLQNEGFVNIKIENKTKIVTFMEENRHFTVNLIENRVKKS